ncbi:hypothetical protein [Qipengyuania nanhaisediminis]|uniref:hypothetical protein n=1 Tax=Qipengyuania nanhaisediminis TaxID=604088 RepID=UPI0015A60BE0|nr:hypothetical protein [Qipengyuania nanhaisediminis]
MIESESRAAHLQCVELDQAVFKLVYDRGEPGVVCRVVHFGGRECTMQIAMR